MEEWRDIKGYEGYYQVSDFGNVRSVDRYRKVTKDGKMVLIKGNSISKVDNGNGYKTASLFKDNKGKRIYIHCLVAEAFIPNPNNYDYVNHKDENKENNAVWNLEWCDGTYNNLYGTRPLRFRKSRGKAVVRINPKTKEETFYFSAREAAKDNNTDAGNIIKSSKIENKIFKGYYWRPAYYGELKKYNLI